MKQTILLLIISLIILGCKKSYVKEWNDFETNLIKNEKSFQNYQEFSDQEADFKLTNYKSEGVQLKALLNTKHIDSTIKKPVIVYLHGGFALRYNEVLNTIPFTDAGYIVFAPSYRGENGNAGNFELFMGEVQDAKAAINWIAQQSFVDTNRIYVFGWSVGGGIALNLSLHDNIPVKLTGSSAGLYDLDLIKSWATEDDMIKFPYDYTNKDENYFRLPLYNLDKMAINHFTYIGKNDDYNYSQGLVDSLYANKATKLRLREVLGNHVTSVPKAMRKFMNEIRKLEKRNAKTQH
jgi:dipeptidyl aminopeptidase/acylaminoacyl peptidase